MEFKYNRILIFGYGKSGKSVENLLLSRGMSYKVFDDGLRLSGGKYIHRVDGKSLREFDLVVVSPGVSVFDKRVRLAESMGIKIIGEVELGYLFCDVPIIAITGTDGKTTTVNLIQHIFKNSGVSSALLGNVGDPFCDIIKYPTVDYVVLEISSFQLETTDKFKPYIGAILNIDEDHLDRHKSMDNYIKAKMDLFKNCNDKCFAILNADDECTMQNLSNVFAKAVFFNDKKGLNIRDDKIFIGNRVFCEGVSSFCTSKVFYDDILVAIQVALLLKVSKDNIIANLKTFKWLEHRVQLVAEINGVQFINDSKATNFHACMCAIKSIDRKVTLLLGGQDKGLDANEFITGLPENVNRVILFGKKMKKMQKSCKKANIFFDFFDNLEDAFDFVADTSVAGEVVLLSPGHSSFDSYSSYKDRGNHFIDLVNKRKM